MDKWELKKKDGKVYGPVDTETLIKWIKEKRVLSDDLISPQGENKWEKAGEISPFKESFSPSIEEKSEEIICPNCGKRWPPGTVICTNCGTNLKTGKKIGSSVPVQQTSSTTLVSISCLRNAFQILKSNPLNLAGISFLFLLLLAIPQKVPKIGWLISLILFPVIIVGFYELSLKKVRGENAGVGTLFSPFSFFLPSFGLVILKRIAESIAYFFLVIPGVFLSLAFSFSFFLVGDERKGPIQALKESFELTKGLRWKIMAIFSLCSLINIAGFLAIGIGFLFTFPLSFLSLATFYNRVKLGEMEEERKYTSMKEILIALIPFLVFIGLFIVMAIIALPKMIILFHRVIKLATLK